MSIGPLMTTGEAVVIVTAVSFAVLALCVCAIVIIDAATGIIFNRKGYDEKAPDETDTTGNGASPW